MNYTHAYSTFAVRSLPQSRAAEQLRQPRADQGRGAGRLHRQLQVSLAGQRAPRRRHVRADADPQGAPSGHAGPRAGRGLRRGVDHADPGQASRTASPSPPRCSTIPAAWARGRPSRARAPPAIRPASRPCRWRSWRPRCRSSSTGKELRLGSGGAGASRGGDGQVIGLHMRTDEPWLLNAVPSRTTSRPKASAAASPARPAVPGQRQAGQRGAQDDDAARRSGDAGNARRRRLRVAVVIRRHCEEHSDEAIQRSKGLDCFASLAMTRRG